MKELAWHALSVEEVVRILKTDPESGLSKIEAESRFEKYGPNDFEKRPSFRLHKIIWAQLKSPLVLVLIIAGFISILLENRTDAAVIFLAVAINTIIGALQEGRASKAFDQLRQAIKTRAVVFRDGQKQEIETAFMVPGDLILVQSGDRVPADSKIMESKALEANESVLTGEWAPVLKGVEQSSVLRMGTTLTEGWAKAIVVATGEKTEFGKIAGLVGKTKEALTPFQKGVKKIAVWIGMLTAIVILAIFLLGILRGHEFGEMFLTAVAVAVSIVPEGLPVAVTVVLAIGMRRIMAHGGLVRKLVAAETLGSTSVILTDKTGTLTQAKMEAVEIITCARSATKANLDLSGGVYETLKAAAFASAAFVENPEDRPSERRIKGRPTDQAMLEASIHAGLSLDALLEKEPRIDLLPFESERRYSASLHKNGDKSVIYIAGAPEVLFPMSDLALVGNEIRQFGSDLREKMSAASSEATGRGERIIAIAYREGDWQEIVRRKDHMFEKTVFLGLISLSDPLRPEVAETIKRAKAAGIKIVLVTGDHSATAKAVAESAGLVDDWSKVKILEGDEVEEMSPEELQKIVPEVAVFARVLPHQKMAIADAWQARGEIVAMTGDGVNDAPTLERADIGVALGSGTDVAKESSDIVLTQDNFGIIFHAIEEGRVILDNLRKIITYLLSTSFSEVVLISGALILGLPLPILPAQILWANIVQEGFMNFALAFEPKEDDVLKRNPKTNSSKKILSREMLYVVFGVGLITSFFLLVLFLFLFRLGLPLQELRTLMFVGISLDALFFAFSFKSLRKSLWRINLFSNVYLLGALAVSFLLLAGALYLDPLSGLLGVVSPSGLDLAILAAIALFNLASIEIAKFYFIRHQNKYKMEV